MERMDRFTVIWSIRKHTVSKVAGVVVSIVVCLNCVRFRQGYGHRRHYFVVDDVLYILSIVLIFRR